MSTLEVNTIDSVSGTSNITIGSGNSSQITLKSGATLTNFPDNSPILSIGLASTQNINDNTWTTVVFDTELLDASNIYNTSTGVCTPTAGTYFMTFTATIGGDTNSSLQNAGVKFNIGGTVYAEQTINSASNNTRFANIVTSFIHTFDGSTYVLCQAYNDVSSGQAQVYGVSSTRLGATFQMVKLI